MTTDPALEDHAPPAGAQAGAPAAGRAARKLAFLDAAGWAGARVAPLAGDASARRYDRVTLDGRRAVLMDAPPETAGDVAPFLAMTAYLRGRGFSAPEPLAEDRAQGFVLLEDLGDGLFARICQRTPAQEDALYAAAADLLAELHAAPPPARVQGWTIPPYDADLLCAEAARLVEWWIPAAAGSPPSADMEAEFRALVAEATARVADRRTALVLRDYHAENLVWLPGRAGAARVGLLDYQDALIGAPAYDLVSLLEDARRDTTPELRRRAFDRYARAAGADREALSADCAALAAQRNLKIVGLFARLWLRDAKPQYLDLIPRVWAHLKRDLSHPELAPLAAFVEAHAPPPTPGTLARVRAARA